MAITGKDIQQMVNHWLSTPLNGYLGSDYGQDARRLLQSPMSRGRADAFIRKMREDIIILNALPSGSVNIYSKNVGIDKVRVYVEVAGSNLEIKENI